jgi:hypothetical protein
MTFADRYPIARFEEMLALPERDRQKHVDAHAIPAAMAHLTAARDAGLMVAVPGSGGRRIRLVDAWNRFVSKDGREDGTLPWTMGFTFLLGVITAELTSVRKAHEGICDAFDRGDMRYETRGARFRFSSNHDEVSGLECELVVEGWKPKLVSFDLATMSYVTLEDLAAIPLQTLEIDLPTGELVIADWFQMNGVTDAIEARLEKRLDDHRSGIQYSPGTDAGNVNLAKANLEDVGILRIAADKTTVVIEVSETGDRLLAADAWFPGKRGDRNAPPEGFVRAGSVGCDTRAIYLADASRIVDLIAESGEEDATTALRTHLDSPDFRFNTCAKVEPGRWRVHFGPRFQARADRRKLGIPKGVSPWFWMERIGGTTVAA